MAVAAVSAFWHGLAPGYYLSFIFIPFAQDVQDRCSKKFLPYLNEKQQVWYYWVSWFIGFRLLEYFGVGVWVHSMSLTLRCWKSMRYYGHILVLILFLLTIIVPDARSKQQEKTSHEKPSPEKKTS
jgi:lysophospholipid acyltransferase 7